VIALVTGGSSALAVVPAEGITLEDKVVVNRLLLGSGVDIVSMNAVRKHLSRIKGGLLGAACGCQIVNFTVSDVVGDPLDYFTDLTVGDTSTFAMAQRTCDEFGLWERLPPAATERLRHADPAEETPRRLDAVDSYVLANSSLMCEAAVAEAHRLGYAAELVGLDLEGESHELGRELARRLSTAPLGTCLVAGGEATVTLGDAAAEASTSTPGAGGPSQEAALAAALALGAPRPDARTLGPGSVSCALFLDSDGTDGPTDAAGGLVDDLTATQAREGGLDIGAALTAHSSHTALARLGDLVITGPTRTNVNDLKVLLKGSTRD
jgi:glycerate 2-kinase